MTPQIIGAIVLTLTLAIGIMRWIKRIKSERRRLAEEARRQYEEAVKSGDTSAITAAMSRINRLR